MSLKTKTQAEREAAYRAAIADLAANVERQRQLVRDAH